MISENQGNNLFDGIGLSSNFKQNSYHLIVCDHPLMAQLGLNAFTTGELYEWITQTSPDSEKQLINLKIFGIDKKLDSDERINLGNYRTGFEVILGLVGTTDFVFSPFRKEKRGGKYVEYTISNKKSKWFYDSRKFDDIIINDFNDKIVKPDLPQLEQNDNLDTELCNIIEMNNYVRIKKILEPSIEKWAENKDKARYDFILDIKSSKERCIQWSGVLPFNIYPYGDKKSSEIKETVNFKLFLFDDVKKPKNSRKVTFNEITVVSPKVDAIGRTGFKKDGELTTPSLKINPKDSVASNLNLYWNEFEGKWQSGTPQITAMLTTPIEAAEIPSLGDFLNNSIDDLLDPKNSLHVKTGSAIPLFMQNGNPLLVSPDYLLSKNERSVKNPTPSGINNKATVKVYNRTSQVYNSGDLVVLSKIDGVWQPISLGTGEQVPEEIVVTPAINGQWEFIYLMTDVEHFFRRKKIENENYGKKISYQDFENSVYSLYYQDDPLNSTNFPTANCSIDSNAFFQITSFDFMGPNIGGLRASGNALAATHFNQSPNGDSYDDYFIRGDHSSPFFGCVFPDGYNPTAAKFAKLKAGIDGKFISKAYMNRSDVPKFIRDIASGTPVLQNNNVNTFNGNGGGMFILQDDSTLKHLPADIALNAAPDSIYGGPIRSLQDFGHFESTDNNSPVNFRTRINGIFESNKNDSRVNTFWSYKENSNESLFDFKPLNLGRVQFRPMKMETYAIFEHSKYPDEFYPTYLNGYGASPQNAIRGEIGSIPWLKMNDKQSPISLDVIKRNNFNSLTISENILFGNNGLKYNIDINANPEIYPGFNQNAKFPWPFWRRSWMNHPGRQNPFADYKGAGCVGIIGAKCRISAALKINFETEYLLGMQTWGGSFSFNPSWGGYTSDTYDAIYTTQLFARVYEAWPRELTVYDPRFFSVFHFNPGAGSGYNKNPNSEIINGKLIDKIETIVDIRVPTYEADPASYMQVDDFTSDTIRIICAEGEFVTKKDIGNRPEWVLNNQYQNFTGIRNESEWNVYTARRGKLLPYKYKYNTIGIRNTSNNALISILKEDLPRNIDDVLKDPDGSEKDPENLKADKVFYCRDFDVLIVSGGTGYKNTDTFTIQNAEDVILQPIMLDTNGGIKGMKVVSNGHDLKFKDILPEALTLLTQELADQNSFNAVIIPLKVDSGGKNFDGYILRASVAEWTGIDIKPRIATDPELIKLTPSAPGVDGSSSVPPIEGIFQQFATIASGSRVDRKDTTLSPYGQFDVFLHFHNDPSHTWTYAPGNIPTVAQNHVTTTIRPE